jgi:hypothetical protein
MALSRRKFLKLAGLAYGAALLPPLPPEESPRQAEGLGRAIHTIRIHDRPSADAPQVGLLAAETVFSIFGTVLSDDDNTNRTWFEMQRGFVHSAAVQPVRWLLNEPVGAMPEGGFLGEVTVPYTLAKTGPGSGFRTDYRFYYSTTYWITDMAADDEDNVWYRALDDRLRKYNWIRAEHVRRVRDSEITPLAPGKTKRIEVDLRRQTLRCFEDDVNVLETLCSTGVLLRVEDGRRVYGTPAGDWSIIRKRPTRHMAGDDGAAADFFDLPGVPWVSYFHWWGVSFHGTYWHNDYGRPRSHGCVNLQPETAKWLFRWCRPDAGLIEETRGDGTSVLVY